MQHESQCPATYDAGDASLYSSFATRHGLTAREADLLPLAYRHYSARRIGELLFISPATVYTHLKRIYRKCGVHSREQLVDALDTWGT